MSGRSVECSHCRGAGRLFGDNALAVWVGLRVAELRKAKGLTQHDLANKLQVGRTQLANIEKGRGANSLSTLVSIADALGVNVKELLP